jgi:hypothetical protein
MADRFWVVFFDKNEPQVINVLIRCLMFVVAAAISSSLSAGIIVDIQDATISAGGTGFVDVLISSTGTDDLASFTYEFEISAPTVNGALRFSAIQNSSETTATSPDYVFLNDSQAFIAARQDPDEQRLVGGDGATANVSITGTQLLLARLELEHITATPLAAVGDTFTVSLVPGLNTDFLDENFISLTQEPFSSGTITITSAAVPEPASATVLLAGSAVGLWWKRRKHRKPENIDAG